MDGEVYVCLFLGGGGWGGGGLKNSMFGKVLCVGIKANRTESYAKLILCNAHSSSPFP